VSGSLEGSIQLGVDSDSGVIVKTKTTTNMSIGVGALFTESTLRWYACGY
jgi:hypothetical protein